MIVHAKVKPVHQQPEWVLCCEGQRQDILDTAEKIIEVDTSHTIEVGPSRCAYCGKRIPSDIKCFRVAESSLAIAIECFDFDEGEA